MVVGVLHVELTLPGSDSLKDKRRLLDSLIRRLHNRFNVSVAEVDRQDARRSARLAVACVSGDRRHANEILSRVMSVVDREGEMVVVHYEIELR